MSTAQPLESEAHEQRTAKVVAGGSTLEAVAGSAAVVLAILGLIGVAPGLLAAIAAIVVGAALLSEGGAVASRYRDLVSGVSGEPGELGAGMTAEILGGIAGIALGILALLGVSRWPLLGIAAIAFGGSMMVGSWLVTALDQARIGSGTSTPRPSAEHAARQAVKAAAGPQLLVGLGAVALGILALIGLSSHALTLIAFLGVGAATLLAGAVVTSRFTGTGERH
jgi:hypothetical protein